MKAIKKLLVVAVAGATLTACCGQCDKPKFDAKEYAKHKTERIDKIVELTDAQQSEVYALYLEQGKEMKKNIKAFKKECANMKQPDCKKAECGKPCPPKPECKKGECDKAKCDACPKKAECKKGECNKPCAPKCDKPCPPKPECGKPMPRPHRPELVSPESKRATFEKLGTILTPEQNAKLKEHYAKRHACRPDKKACTPCATVQK